MPRGRPKGSKNVRKPVVVQSSKAPSSKASPATNDPPQKRIEKQESKSLIPPSAAETLERVKMLFVINKFRVNDLPQKRREYTRDSYISPVEFSVNGVEVSLYGNRLVLDGKIIYDVDVHNAIDSYRAIDRAVKNKKQAKAPEQRMQNKSLPARYIAYASF